MLRARSLLPPLMHFTAHDKAISQAPFSLTSHYVLPVFFMTVSVPTNRSGTIYDQHDRLKKTLVLGQAQLLLSVQGRCESEKDLLLQNCDHWHLTVARFSLPPVADTAFRGRAQSHPPL